MGKPGNVGAIAVSIPEHLFSNPAYRSLATLDRCLLIELLAVAKRIGTDELINCSVRMAADMCGVGKSHAATSLATLEARGFIVRVRRGERRQRRGFASSWRITCLPFRYAWPTCDYNRTIDRERNRKVADDRKGETRFFTPELEALWVETEASFTAGTVQWGGQVKGGGLSDFTSMKSIRCSEVSGGADIYMGRRLFLDCRLCSPRLSVRGIRGRKLSGASASASTLVVGPTIRAGPISGKPDADRQPSPSSDAS